MTTYRCQACVGMEVRNPTLHENQVHGGAQTCWPDDLRHRATCIICRRIGTLINGRCLLCSPLVRRRPEDVVDPNPSCYHQHIVAVVDRDDPERAFAHCLHCERSLNDWCFVGEHIHEYRQTPGSFTWTRQQQEATP